MSELGKILGRNIAFKRKALKLTQEDLAKGVGLEFPQIISSIEQGKREVSAWELVKIANFLKTSTATLLSAEEPQLIPDILWRKIPDHEEGRKAEFIKKCLDYHELEKMNEHTKPEPFPSEKVNFDDITYTDVARMADKISKELDLGSRPAAVLERALEDRYGVKVWYTDLGQEGSAASAYGDFGPAILMNSREAPWRRNYNFAHEVFHLVTWNSIHPSVLRSDEGLWNKVEKFADAFASYLLLPSEMLTMAFDKRVKNNKISYTDLIEIAREFDVSTEALLYRLSNLRRFKRKVIDDLLNDPEFRLMDRSTMKGAWWTPPEIPERYVRLAYIAYKRGKITKSRLAQHLKTSLLDIDDLLREYGLDTAEIDQTIKVRYS